MIKTDKFSDLPPYLSIIICPKCNNSFNKYKRIIVYNDGSYYGIKKHWYGYKEIYCKGVEHIDVKCGLCGYSWKERCVDNE